jgi:hypothetical protein
MFYGIYVLELESGLQAAPSKNIIRFIEDK